MHSGSKLMSASRRVILKTFAKLIEKLFLLSHRNGLTFWNRPRKNLKQLIVLSQLRDIMPKISQTSHFSISNFPRGMGGIMYIKSFLYLPDSSFLQMIYNMKLMHIHGIAVTVNITIQYQFVITFRMKTF